METGRTPVSTVVIAGAGIGGLAAALAFRRSGAAVTVLERTPALGAVGAGILVQANGLLVLDALGIGDAVREAGVQLRSFDLRDRRGRVLLSTDFGDVLSPHLFPLSIHRAELHRILWDACAEYGVELRLGCTVTGTGPAAIDPSVTYEVAGRAGRAHGDLVIAADGVRSVIRDAAGFTSHTDPVIEGSVQGVAPISVPDGVRGEFIGGGEACGMLPVGGGRTFWFWGGSGRAVSHIEGASYVEWKERVCDGFPAMRTVLDAHDGWPGLVRLLHGTVRCERWSRGRVVLLGDAAHAMSPNLGQGANCALVDALVLVAHVSAGETIDAALAAYERDRRPMVDEMQRRGQQEGIAGTQGWPGAETLVKFAIRLARFTPAPRRRAELRFMSGLERDGTDLGAAGVRQPLPWGQATG